MSTIGIDFGSSNTFVILSKPDTNNPGKYIYSVLGENLYDLFSNVSHGGSLLCVSKGIKTNISLEITNGKEDWKIGKEAKEAKEAKEEEEAKEKEEEKDVYFVCEIKQKIRAIIKNVEIDAINSETDIDEWLKKMDESLSKNPRAEEYGLKVSDDKYYSAFRLAEKFFEVLFDSITYNVPNKEGHIKAIFGDENVTSIEKDTSIEKVTSIVITAPIELNTAENCTYKMFLEKKIGNIVKNKLESFGVAADKLVIACRDEPSMAGIAFNECFEVEHINNGENLLIIDVGGGTTDFSLLSMQDGKFQTPYGSYGGVTPAGHEFNQAISESLSGLTVEKNVCERIKEGLFQSSTTWKEYLLGKRGTMKKKMGDIYAELASGDIYAEPVSPDFIKAWKEKKEHEYIKYFHRDFYNIGGRRITQQIDDKEIKIAYSERDKRGLVGDGYGSPKPYFDEKYDEWSDQDSVYYIKDNFEKKYEDIGRSLNSYFKDPGNGKEKLLHTPIHKVLFVGGSSSIDMLREYILEDILSVDSKTKKRVVDDKTYEVKDYFFGIEGNRAFTCFNSVAMGAAIAARNLKDCDFINCPTLYLEVYDKNKVLVREPLIFSQLYKQTGKDDKLSADAIQYIEYDPKKFDSKIYFKLRQEYYQNGEKITRSFPKNTYYSWHIDKHELKDNYGFVFFADQIEQFTYIFTIKLQKFNGNQTTNAKKYLLKSYEFETGEGTVNSIKLNWKDCAFWGKANFCAYYLLNNTGAESKKRIGVSNQKNTIAKDRFKMMSDCEEGLHEI